MQFSKKVKQLGLSIDETKANGDSEPSDCSMGADHIQGKEQLPTTKPPLPNDELDLKISKLELIISALDGFLLTSQPQEDELKKLFSSLKVLLEGALFDAYNAGHSPECGFVQRIINGIETIESVRKSESGEKLTD